MNFEKLRKNFALTKKKKIARKPRDKFAFERDNKKL